MRSFLAPSTPVLVVSGALLLASGCVRSKEPPNPTLQTKVPYGPRIMLADATQNGRSLTCRQTGTVTTSSTTVQIDGQDVDPTEPVNCYVGVMPGELEVDVLEVTNDLYQLCVDSGVCKKPDPSTVEKAQICSDGSAFDRCPVVSVPQYEAVRFCEFVGRRLPSGVEHVIMRQANKPQSGAEVLPFPTGRQSPVGQCASATLENCGAPRPATLGPTLAETKGGSVGDVTDQGVYDLMGNVAEWSADLIPVPQNTNPFFTLPWFCARPLPNRAAGEPPTCPDGEACIHGRYDPDGTGPLPAREDWPVCVASPKLSVTNGTRGSLFGGSFKSNVAGTFARFEVEQPDDEAANEGGSFGFRCVGEAGVVSALRPERAPPIVLPDAGVLPDTGSPDSGSPIDAGDTDAGLLPDAGDPLDGALPDTGTSSTADAG